MDYDSWTMRNLIETTKRLNINVRPRSIRTDRRPSFVNNRPPIKKSDYVKALEEVDESRTTPLLLGLPPEVQMIVYEMVLTPDRRRKKTKNHLEIWQVRMEIYPDALKALYGCPTRLTITPTKIVVNQTTIFQDKQIGDIPMDALLAPFPDFVFQLRNLRIAF